MKPRYSFWVMVLVLAAILALSGCGAFDSTFKDEEEPVELAPPVGPRYLDFDDVQIPAELKLVRESSFVYESGAIKAGVLNLAGRADLMEVLDFYQNNMIRDGWKLMSSFKSNRNILIYTKPEKVCLIIAKHPVSLYQLKVEIWVAPITEGFTHQSAQPDKAGQSLLEPIIGGDTKTGILPLLNKKKAEPKEENL